MAVSLVRGRTAQPNPVLHDERKDSTWSNPLMGELPLEFEFTCDQPAELKGTACEASRDVESAPPGQPPLAFTVFLTDSPEILLDGKSLAACTIMPRGGNVFR